MIDRPTYKELEVKVKQLEGSENLYRHLFETAMVGIYRTRIKDGKFIAANKTLSQMMGYQSINTFVEEYVTSENYVYPKHREKLFKQLELDGQVGGFETEMRRADGSQIHIALSATIYPDLGYIEGVIIDITKQKQAQHKAEEALKNAEDAGTQLEEAISRANTIAIEAEVTSLELNQIFNSTSDGICVIDKDFQIIKCNQTITAMMAEVGLQIDTGSCRELLGNGLCGTDRCVVKRIFKGRLERKEEEIEMKANDGRSLIFLITALPLIDLDNDIVGAVVSCKDITARKQMEEEVRRLAMTDPLTGAFNRRHFLQRAEEEIDRAKRYHTPLCLLILDIDHFKSINDTFGHDAGDEVLKVLVSECQSTLRNSDIFCRFGGEEFAAMLPQTVPESGLQVVERLRKVLKALTVQTASGPVQFTVSIGVTPWTKDAASLEETMKKADTALYEAKGSGRDRVVLR